MVQMDKWRGIQKASCPIHVSKNKKKRGNSVQGWTGRMHKDSSKPRVVPSIFPCSSLDLSNRADVLAVEHCWPQLAALSSPCQGCDPRSCPALEGKGSVKCATGWRGTAGAALAWEWCSSQPEPCEVHLPGRPEQGNWTEGSKTQWQR